MENIELQNTNKPVQTVFDLGEPKTFFQYDDIKNPIPLKPHQVTRLKDCIKFLALDYYKSNRDAKDIVKHVKYVKSIELPDVMEEVCCSCLCVRMRRTREELELEIIYIIQQNPTGELNCLNSRSINYSLCAKCKIKNNEITKYNRRRLELINELVIHLGL